MRACAASYVWCSRFGGGPVIEPKTRQQKNQSASRIPDALAPWYEQVRRVNSTVSSSYSSRDRWSCERPMPSMIASMDSFASALTMTTPVSMMRFPAFSGFVSRPVATSARSMRG
jgi:hypothetical protein